MADKFKRVFKMDGLAETSFISTARLKGYSPDLIHQIAATFWPEGYAAGRMKGKWCIQPS